NKTIDTLPLNFRILIKLAPLPLISGIIMAIISTMLSLAPLWIIYKKHPDVRQYDLLPLIPNVKLK
ncbi:hypothetical protein FCH03_029020, partial [Klebsiella pneumoniae]